MSNNILINEERFKRIIYQAYLNGKEDMKKKSFDEWFHKIIMLGDVKK